MKLRSLSMLFFITINCYSQSLDAYYLPGGNGHMKVPSLTTSQINAIDSPLEGMQAYDKIAHCMKYFNGVSWTCFGTNTESLPQPSNCSAWQIGGSLLSMKSDLNGNIFTLTNDTGLYDGNYVVSKYSPLGVLLWSNVICPLSTSYPGASANGDLKIDKQNRVIIVARGKSSNTPPYNSSFLNVYDNTNGNLIKTRSVANFFRGGPSLTGFYNTQADYEIDSKGNLILIGSITGNWSITPSITLNPYRDDANIDRYVTNYIVKIDSNNNVLAAKRWICQPYISADTWTGNKISDVELDENDNIYIVGRYNNTTISNIEMSNYNDTETYTLPIEHDTYILKLNPDIVPIWVYSRPLALVSYYGEMAADAVKEPLIKISGNDIYLVGRKVSTVAPGVIYTEQNMIVEKINKETKNVLWTKIFNKPLTLPYSTPIYSSKMTGIAFDNTGSMYIGGGLDGCFNFGSTQVCGSSTTNQNGVLKLKTSNGDFVSHTFFGNNAKSKGYFFMLINKNGLYTGSIFDGINVPFGNTTLSSSSTVTTAIMICD